MLWSALNGKPSFFHGSQIRQFVVCVYTSCSCIVQGLHYFTLVKGKDISLCCTDFPFSFSLNALSNPKEFFFSCISFFCFVLLPQGTYFLSVSLHHCTFVQLLWSSIWSSNSAAFESSDRCLIKITLMWYTAEIHKDTWDLLWTQSMVLYYQLPVSVWTLSYHKLCIVVLGRQICALRYKEWISITEAAQW